MAYNALNNLIDAYIYANGVQAITGSILNNVLKAMVSQLGGGYNLMGVAAPASSPAVNDEPQAYFAATAGTYTNFDGIVLAAGEVAVLLTSGNGSWSKQTIYNVPTGTADLANTAGFITSAVNTLVNYYTKTEIDTALSGYTTTAALATALADYYNKAAIDAQMATRYTKSEVDSIVAALSRQEYIVAWDGSSAPVVADIPAGVTVTYSGNPYTGTLAASAATVNKIYMVWNGVAYDMYGTSQDGGYSWVPMGTTSVDLSQYATKAEFSQLEQEVTDLSTEYALNLNDYSVDNYTISVSNTWYTKGTHRAIPVTPGQVYILNSVNRGSHYAWLDNTYVAPTATSDPVSILSGTERKDLSTNTPIKVVVPQGAAYLYIEVYDPNWDAVTMNVTYCGDIPVMKENIADLQEKVNPLYTEEIIFTDLAKHNYIIAVTNWYSAGTHRVIEVSPGDTFSIESVGYDSDYAWLTNSYNPPSSPGGAAPIVSGTSLYSVTADTPKTITAPEGAAYLYLVNENGAWVQRSWNIYKIGVLSVTKERIDYIDDEIVLSKEINTANYTSYPHIVSGPTWYSSGSHKVIPVVPNDRYVLESIGNASNYAWLTNEYTTPDTGDPIPYVPGTERTDTIADTPTTVIVPEGAAYLCIPNENGAWTQINWRIERIGDVPSLKERVSALEDGKPVGESIPYTGEKVAIEHRLGALKIYSVSARRNTKYPQGMAIYGGYLFRLYDGGGCEVYNIANGDPELVGSYDLPISSIDPHCNSAQFAEDVVSGDFPYLYVSNCKNAREIYVLSVTTSSATLLQTITVANDVTPVPLGVYPDAAIRDGYLFMAVYDGIDKLYFSKFVAPDVLDGDVTLTNADVLDSWVIDGFDWNLQANQGLKVYGNRLYYCMSAQYGTHGVWIFDVFTHERVTKIDITSFANTELEDIDFFGNMMVVSNVSDFLIYLTF